MGCPQTDVIVFGQSYEMGVCLVGMEAEELHIVVVGGEGASLLQDVWGLAEVTDEEGDGEEDEEEEDGKGNEESGMTLEEWFFR